MKRFARALLALIAVAGITLVLWPLGQNAYARWNQHNLRAAWSAPQPRPQHRLPLPQPGKSPPATQSSIVNGQSPSEWPPTRLIIPSLGLDVVVVQGFDDDALRRGPGHCPTSALPGAPGNCIIAGHRNVYGGWFYKVPDIDPGTTIKLRTPDATFTYVALLTKTVSATDTSLFEPAPAGSPPRLELLTCTMPHSPDRVLLIAEMDEHHTPH